jgi:hypothetical protein
VQRKGEFTAEVINEVFPIFFIQVNDDLGIRVRGEPMSTTFEISADVSEAVNLAVQGDPDGLVFVGDGLVAIRNINNGQPEVDERYGALGSDVEAPTVGPSMGEDRRHGTDGAQIDLSPSLKCNLTGNAAHVQWRF